MLNSIGAGQGMGPHTSSASDLDRPDGPQLRIVSDRPNDDGAEATDHAEPSQRHPWIGFSDIDILQSTVESAQQIQQLAIRLDRVKTELVEKEQSLHARICSWKTTVEEQEQAFEKRCLQLQQQSAQARLQQRHLMQLQNDIVRSYEAAKTAISSIVDDQAQGQNGFQLTQQMKSLQQELGSRFDYIARRWDHLFRLLENQRVQLDAAQSADDRVRWTA
ncbi:MAG: hypothetical protein AAFN77_06510 [Planctomycetota bacterium]